MSSLPKNLSSSPTRLKSVKPIRVPVLVNTRMAGRIADGLAGRDADLSRETRLLRDAGIEAVLYDRGNFPANPWAGKHLLYAGIDPLRALRILLTERRADAVLCVFENTALALLLLRRLFGFRIPIVLQEVSSRGWRPRDMMLDYVVPRVDYVVTMTTAQQEYAQSTWRLRRPPELVDWAVDEEFYHPLPPPAHGYVLAVGDDLSRDFPTLVAACAELDCQVVLKTRQVVAVPPAMKDRVRLIPDRLTGTELRQLYAGARVMVVPLRPTNNPGGISSLLEAMSMGRPVVASDAGVPRHVMTHDVDGFIVAPTDVGALEAALKQLLTDDDLAARLGVAARATVERRFALSVRTEAMAALFRRITGTPSSTG